MNETKKQKNKKTKNLMSIVYSLLSTVYRLRAAAGSRQPVVGNHQLDRHGVLSLPRTLHSAVRTPHFLFTFLPFHLYQSPNYQITKLPNRQSPLRLTPYSLLLFFLCFISLTSPALSAENRLEDIYSNTEQELKKSIEANPKDAELKIQLAETYLLSNKQEEAEKLLKEVITQDPNNATVHTDLGTLYNIQGKHESALTEHLTATQLDPQHPTAYNNLGYTYYLLGQDEKARESLKKSILINTNYILEGMSSTLAKRVRMEIKEISERDKMMMSFYFENLSFSYLVLGNVGKSIENLEKAIALDPKNMVLATKLDQARIARKSPTALAKISPEAAKSVELENAKVAEQLIIDTNYKEAINVLEKIVKTGVEDANILTNLGISYDSLGEYDKAIEYHKKAISQQPDHPTVHNNLGHAYEMKENYKQAITEYKKALDINPKLQIAHENLGSTYLKQGEFAKAIEEEEKALEMNPKSPSAYNNLAFAYYKKGDTAKAIEILDKGMEVSPNNPTIARNYTFIKGLIDKEKVVITQAPSPASSSSSTAKKKIQKTSKTAKTKDTSQTMQIATTSVESNTQTTEDKKQETTSTTAEAAKTIPESAKTTTTQTTQTAVSVITQKQQLVVSSRQTTGHKAQGTRQLSITKSPNHQIANSSSTSAISFKGNKTLTVSYKLATLSGVTILPADPELFAPLGIDVYSSPNRVIFTTEILSEKREWQKKEVIITQGRMYGAKKDWVNAPFVLDKLNVQYEIEQGKKLITMWQEHPVKSRPIIAVNGVKIKFAQAPLIVDDITFVSVDKHFAQNFGAASAELKQKKAKLAVEIMLSGRKYEFTEREIYFKIDNTSKKLQKAPFVRNGYLMIPIRRLTSDRPDTYIAWNRNNYLVEYNYGISKAKEIATAELAPETKDLEKSKTDASKISADKDKDASQTTAKTDEKTKHPIIEALNTVVDETIKELRASRTAPSTPPTTKGEGDSLSKPSTPSEKEKPTTAAAADTTVPETAAEPTTTTTATTKDIAVSATQKTVVEQTTTPSDESTPLAQRTKRRIKMSLGFAILLLTGL